MQLRRKSYGIAAGLLAGFTLALLPGLSMGDTNAQITNASKQVHDAQIGVNGARQQMARARTRIATTVQAKPQWAAAVKEFKAAQAAFAAAKRQALADLQRRPEYQALVTDRGRARDTLAQADAPDSRLTDAQIRKATDLLMQDGLQLRKMQDEVFAQQPDYQAAKDRLDSAQLQMDQLDAEITQEAQNDPDYQEGEQQLATAEQRLSQARGQLAQAVQADQQRREQEAKAREQQQASFGQ